MSPGRPKLPADQKRTIRKGIAFSPEEYDRLCLIAYRLGMDVNEFIRLMVVGRVESRSERATELPSLR